MTIASRWVMTIAVSGAPVPSQSSASCELHLSFFADFFVGLPQLPCALTVFLRRGGGLFLLFLRLRRWRCERDDLGDVSSLVFQSLHKGGPMNDGNIRNRHLKPAALQLGIDPRKV